MRLSSSSALWLSSPILADDGDAAAATARNSLLFAGDPAP
jgi:hypothetical protein